MRREWDVERCTFTIPSMPHPAAMISPQYLSLHHDMDQPPSAYTLPSTSNPKDGSLKTYLARSQAWSPWELILVLRRLLLEGMRDERDRRAV